MIRNGSKLNTGWIKASRDGAERRREPGEERENNCKNERREEKKEKRLAAIK